MSIEILRRAIADTDYTIPYIDGRAAAISEKRSGGGHYAFVEDRDYIYNESGVRRQRIGPAPSATRSTGAEQRRRGPRPPHGKDDERSGRLGLQDHLEA